MNNPEFAPGRLHKAFETWVAHGITQIYQCFDKTSHQPKTFSKLQEEFDLPKTHKFHYDQMTSYWKQTHLQPTQLFTPTFIDRLIDLKYFSISQIYPMLQMQFLKPLEATPVANWLKDIPEIESVDNLLKGHQHIMGCLTSENAKETQLKILHRAYSTYLRDPSATPEQKPSNKCPKCGTPRPTLFHLIWQCQYIQVFWKDVNVFTIPNGLQNWTLSYTHCYTYLDYK